MKDYITSKERLYFNTDEIRHELYRNILQDLPWIGMLIIIGTFFIYKLLYGANYADTQG
jgi:hypothetical protein